MRIAIVDAGDDARAAPRGAAAELAAGRADATATTTRTRSTSARVEDGGDARGRVPRAAPGVSAASRPDGAALAAARHGHRAGPPRARHRRRWSSPAALGRSRDAAARCSWCDARTSGLALLRSGTASPSTGRVRARRDGIPHPASADVAGIRRFRDRSPRSTSSRVRPADGSSQCVTKRGSARSSRRTARRCCMLPGC